MSTVAGGLAAWLRSMHGYWGNVQVYESKLREAEQLVENAQAVSAHRLHHVMIRTMSSLAPVKLILQYMIVFRFSKSC